MRAHPQAASSAPKVAALFRVAAADNALLQLGTGGSQLQNSSSQLLRNTTICSITTVA
jgi:hypothetical protein